MKKIIATLFLFAAYWRVEAFSPPELDEIICSIPDKYMLRFLECTYDKIPAPFQKIVDIVYQCLDEFYENNGKFYSVLLMVCDNDVKQDENVENCVDKKGRELLLERPSEAVFEQLDEVVKHCLVNAK